MSGGNLQQTAVMNKFFFESHPNKSDTAMTTQSDRCKSYAILQKGLFLLLSAIDQNCSIP
jgi:hypothetical protein